MAGLDEAGRGSLLGPLAVAAVALEAREQGRLREMGIRDSKSLSPGARRRAAALISGMALGEVILIPHWTVDASTKSRGGNLNSLEAAAFARLIADLRPDLAIVDSPDPRPERFGALVGRLLRGAGCLARVIARHHADELYPVVSAASVLAKVARDEKLAEYAWRYGDLGSGYPHDPRTRSFVGGWRTAWGDYPYIVRREWSTVRGRVP
ncbi:MAG: ribonuclease HII [Conexivisphaera sp.]